MCSPGSGQTGCLSLCGFRIHPGLFFFIPCKCPPFSKKNSGVILMEFLSGQSSYCIFPLHEL